MDLNFALELSRKETWGQYAACRGETALMFPHPVGQTPAKQFVEREEPGKALCNACPVRPQCSEYSAGLDSVEEGIYDGKSQRDRAAGTKVLIPITAVIPTAHRCQASSCWNVVEPGARFCSLPCSDSVRKAA